MNWNCFILFDSRDFWQDIHSIGCLRAWFPIVKPCYTILGHFVGLIFNTPRIAAKIRGFIKRRMVGYGWQLNLWGVHRWKLSTIQSQIQHCMALNHGTEKTGSPPTLNFSNWARVISKGHTPEYEVTWPLLFLHHLAGDSLAWMDSVVLDEWIDTSMLAANKIWSR